MVDASGLIVFPIYFLGDIGRSEWRWKLCMGFLLEDVGGLEKGIHYFIAQETGCKQARPPHIYQFVHDPIQEMLQVDG